jgi:hypothetical protein
VNTTADALFNTVFVRNFRKKCDGFMLRAYTLRKVIKKEKLHILVSISTPKYDSSETITLYQKK